MTTSHGAGAPVITTTMIGGFSLTSQQVNSIHDLIEALKGIDSFDAPLEVETSFVNLSNSFTLPSLLYIVSNPTFTTLLEDYSWEDSEARQKAIEDAIGIAREYHNIGSEVAQFV